MSKIDRLVKRKKALKERQAGGFLDISEPVNVEAEPVNNVVRLSEFMQEANKELSIMSDEVSNLEAVTGNNVKRMLVDNQNEKMIERTNEVIEIIAGLRERARKGEIEKLCYASQAEYDSIMIFFGIVKNLKDIYKVNEEEKTVDFIDFVMKLNPAL